MLVSSLGAETLRYSSPLRLPHTECSEIGVERFHACKHQLGCRSSMTVRSVNQAAIERTGKCEKNATERFPTDIFIPSEVLYREDWREGLQDRVVIVYEILGQLHVSTPSG